MHRSGKRWIFHHELWKMKTHNPVVNYSRDENFIQFLSWIFLFRSENGTRERREGILNRWIRMESFIGKFFFVKRRKTATQNTNGMDFPRRKEAIKVWTKLSHTPTHIIKYQRSFTLRDKTIKTQKKMNQSFYCIKEKSS